jgi:hypothetical protein
MGANSAIIRIAIMIGGNRHGIFAQSSGRPASEPFAGAIEFGLFT